MGTKVEIFENLERDYILDDDDGALERLMDAVWHSAMDYSQSDGEKQRLEGVIDIMHRDKEKAEKWFAELSTLREQLRLTNEMLAAADHIGGYLDIARGTTWSIHSDHDSGWHYSVDDKIVASGKSMLEAFAAIREQQGEK